MTERSFYDFDKHANDYRSIHTKNVSISGADSSYFAAHKVQKLAQFEKNQTLTFLDFGCGDGLTETFIENHFPSFKNIGIDVSEKSIDSAKLRRSTKTEYFHFNGLNIPLGNDSVDIVFVAAVFHHIAFDKHVDILKEIYRVMKQGARIYFFEHNPLNPATRYLVKTCVFDEDARLLSHRYGKKIFLESGFKNIACRFMLFFPRWKWFSFLWKIEDKLHKLPLGAQYFIAAKK